MEETLRRVRNAIVDVYNKTHWFTEKEAWWLYRLFAICETVGWTLLITAIVYRAFALPYADSVVMVAGRTHGIFFLAYFGFVLATSRSMGWGFWKLAGALIAGVPPYTSLIYEQFMAWQRRKHPSNISLPDNYYED